MIAVTPDGALAVVALFNGSFRWISIGEGQLLLSFFPHRDQSRWVLWSESGYYDSSIGGEDLFGVPGGHAPLLEAADLVAADPDIIVVMPCGFGLERTTQELAALTSQEFWPKLRAVRAGRVALADGNHYFSRPGPRLVDSVEILAEILHPGIFDFGHAGSGWDAA